jgi:hypothetical protein
MPYNPRNNGGTAHLFGTTAKLPTLGQPAPAERQGQAQPRQAQPMQAPAPAQTFAQMQQGGYARPAPQAPVTAAPMAMPQAQASGSSQPPPWAATNPTLYRQLQAQGYFPPAPATPSAGNNPILNQLSQTLSGMSSTPTRFDTDLYKRLRDQAVGDLDAEFGGRRMALDEEMARRGLWSSSGPLGAGARMGDLEGQYARARGGIETDLLGRAAETQWQDRTTRDQMFMQLAQMLAGMKPADMQKFLKSLNAGG